MVATQEIQVGNDRASGPLSCIRLHTFPSPSVEAAWREFLGQVELPSHYTSPEYFLEPYFEGKNIFTLLAMDGGKVIGVLSGVHEDGTVTCGIPTRPMIQIDPSRDAGEVLDILLRGLQEESQGCSMVSVYSWEWAPLERLCQRGFRARTMSGSCVIDLQLGPDVLMKKVEGKRRSSIRYPIKHGVEVYEGTTPEDYAAFYGIYADWCKRKETSCYSYELEERAFEETKRNRILFLARHEGKVIAGSVLRFFHGGLAEYSRNSSMTEHQQLKPNDLLLWRAIEWCCSQGFRKLSLGGSHRFLREFGGPIVPIIRYRQDRSFLRRQDRKEDLLDWGRDLIGKLPPGWEAKIRSAIGKTRPAGW
jgi:hypothetical protein